MTDTATNPSEQRSPEEMLPIPRTTRAGANMVAWRMRPFGHCFVPRLSPGASGGESSQSEDTASIDPKQREDTESTVLHPNIASCLVSRIHIPMAALGIHPRGMTRDEDKDVITDQREQLQQHDVTHGDMCIQQQTRKPIQKGVTTEGIVFVGTGEYAVEPKEARLLSSRGLPSSWQEFVSQSIVRSSSSSRKRDGDDDDDGDDDTRRACRTVCGLVGNRHYAFMHHAERCPPKHGKYQRPGSSNADPVSSSDPRGNELRIQDGIALYPFGCCGGVNSVVEVESVLNTVHLHSISRDEETKKKDGQHPQSCHPRYQFPALAVTVILQRMSDGAVLLTRRAASLRTFPGSWVLPGGHVDHGERLEDAALRELREEMGDDIADLVCKDAHRSRGVILGEHGKDDIEGSIPDYAPSALSKLPVFGLWESSYPVEPTESCPSRHHLVAFFAFQLDDREGKGVAFGSIRMQPEEVDAYGWVMPYHRRVGENGILRGKVNYADSILTMIEGPVTAKKDSSSSSSSSSAAAAHHPIAASIKCQMLDNVAEGSAYMLCRLFEQTGVEALETKSIPDGDVVDDEKGGKRRIPLPLKSGCYIHYATKLMDEHDEFRDC